MDSYIGRIARGDKAAFEAFYLATKDAVYSFALSILRDRQLAEDALQDSMLALAKSAGGYRQGTNPKAWLFSLVRNCCVNIIRRAPQGTVPLEEAAAYLPAADDIALCGMPCSSSHSKSGKLFPYF